MVELEKYLRRRVLRDKNAHADTSRRDALEEAIEQNQIMHGQLQTEIARHVWQSRYRWTTEAGITEPDIDATWQRVARACAASEDAAAGRWRAAYLQALDDFRFLPGGRILAGAGSGAQMTLCNCFVMGLIEDSLEGICRILEESALTMQRGGGIGLDFSTLRPRGARARDSARIASGPVSFMQVWAAMCDTLTSTTSRGGAMMAALRCDHPDILEFVEAKRPPSVLGSFNLSVLVTDDFMAAVRRDDSWPLVFPAERVDGEGETIERSWPGFDAPVPCRVVGRLPAKVLWETIMRAAYETAEPGVLFIDTVNRENNLAYREQISTTNPCGELPLPPYGACDLGSINLSRFVTAPFRADASLDLDGIRATTRTAVRLLDAVIDISHFPLAAQRRMAEGTRRIGLGITGLADALMLLGLNYDSDSARTQAATVMRTICSTAYETSVELAREKGAFPLVRTAAVSAVPLRAALAGRNPRRHRPLRNTQQPPACDRAYRQHQSVSEQRDNGNRARLRSGLPATRPYGGR